MKKIKNLIYLLLAVFFLIAAGAGAVTADKAITITVPTTEVPYNQTTTVPVLITGNDDTIGSFTIYVNHVNGVTLSPKDPISGEIVIPYTTDGNAGYTYAKSSGFSGDQTLFYVDVTPDGTTKEVKLNITVETLTDNVMPYKDLRSEYPAVNQTLKIQKAPALPTTVTLNSPTGSLTYGATGTASVTVLDQYGDDMKSKATISWKSSNTNVLTVDNTGKYNVISAKTSPVTLTVTAKANGVEKSDAVSLTINKKTLTAADFTYTPKSVEYNGKVQKPTVNYNTGITGAGTITVKYGNSTGADVQPQAKGTYKVNVTTTGGDNYNPITSALTIGNFGITGAVIDEPSIDTTKNNTYTGKELKAPIKDTKSSAGMYTVTKNATATAAGTYTVVLHLLDPENSQWKDHGTSDLKLTWVINPKSIAGTEITITPSSYVYDGSAKTPAIKVGDLTKDKDYKLDTANLTAVAAGTYTIKATGIGNCTGTATGTWTIAKATPAKNILSITPELPKTYLYNGSTFPVKVSAKSGIYGLGAITVTYNGASNPPKNAGTYTVKAVIDAGKNYTQATVDLGTLTLSKLTIQGNKSIDMSKGSVSGTFTATPAGTTGTWSSSDAGVIEITNPATGAYTSVAPGTAMITYKTTAPNAAKATLNITVIKNINPELPIIKVEKDETTGNTTITVKDFATHVVMSPDKLTAVIKDTKEGVNLTVTYVDAAEVKPVDGKIIGEIATIQATYPVQPIASNVSEAGAVTWGMNLTFKDVPKNITGMSPVYNKTIANEIVKKCPEFTPVSMVTAIGKYVDETNANLASNGIEVIFNHTKSFVDEIGGKEKLVAFYYNDTTGVITPLSRTCEEVGDYVLVKVTADSISSIVEGYLSDPYEITVESSIVGGTVSADKKTAYPGETIALTNTPNANYEFVTYYINSVPTTESTFVMPAADVIISAEFKYVAKPEPSHPSSRQSGSSILMQGTATPTPTPTVTPTQTPVQTARPTPSAPTANPTTPQPTKTAASPAPFIGILAGLAASLVLFSLRRR